MKTNSTITQIFQLFLESEEHKNNSKIKKLKNFIFKCYECKRLFESANDYNEHEYQKHSRTLCECCKFFIDSDIYTLHLRKCEHIFNHNPHKNRTRNYLKRTITDKYKKQKGWGEKNILQKLTNTPFILSRKAFRNFLTQYELKNYKIPGRSISFRPSLN